MPTSVERDSNLRRVQRLLAGYALNLVLISKVIFALLPVKTGLVLCLDRTNWKFGEVNINILMLEDTHLRDIDRIARLTAMACMALVWAYVGSANLTGAGIGMKSANRRNFEAGILTDSPQLLQAAIEQFDSVWRGEHCKQCGRKKFCKNPIK